MLFYIIQRFASWFPHFIKSVFGKAGHDLHFWSFSPLLLRSKFLLYVFSRVSLAFFNNELSRGGVDFRP